MEARNVNKANDDYKAVLLAEMKVNAADEEVELNQQQEADLKRLINECDLRLEGVRKVVQSILWSRFGLEELNVAIQEAEKPSDGVVSVPITAVKAINNALQARKSDFNAVQEIAEENNRAPEAAAGVAALNTMPIVRIKTT